MWSFRAPATIADSFIAVSRFQSVRPAMRTVRPLGSFRRGLPSRPITTCVIDFAFIRGRFPCGNQAAYLAARGVDDEGDVFSKQSDALSPFLAVVVSIVDPLDPSAVFEDLSCVRQIDAMLDEVRVAFQLVPLEREF